MPRGNTCKGIGSVGAVSLLGSLVGKAAAAVVMADHDWILCQVTSRPYGNDRAIVIRDHDFETGGLRVASVVRPGKLFTAHATLLTAEVGRLRATAFERIRQGVVSMFA